MRKHRRVALDLVVVLAVVTTLAVATPSPSAQKATLLFKYQAGNELVFEQVMSQKIAMQGMPSLGGNEITSTMRWRVLDVAEDGNASIEVTTERMHGTVASPAGVTSFDSASEEPPTDPAARLLAAQAGMTFRFVLAPNGDVAAVRAG